MKRCLCILSLVLLSLSMLRPEHLGRTVITSTSWEVEGFSPDGGFALASSFSIQGLPLDRSVLTLRSGYRWIDSGEGLSVPGLSLTGGYRIPLPPWLSLKPMAGVYSDFAIIQDGIEPTVGITAGLQLSFLLHDRDYLDLVPSFSFPLMDGTPARFSLAFASRRETPWLIPVPRVKARLSLSDTVFSPDGDGTDDVLGIKAGASSPRYAVTWRLTIADDEGVLWFHSEGEGPPPGRLSWDGVSKKGKLVDAGQNLTVELTVVDVLGRSSVCSRTALVDILVLKDGDRYKVRVPNIHFPADSADMSSVSGSLLEENRAILERLASLFSRFPEHTLTVEGHANAVHWANPARYRQEQVELEELSLRRAQAVRLSLVMLGVAEKRIRVEGYGSRRPLVDFADKNSVWKNRRVEFILSK